MNQDEQEIQVSTAEQSSEYEAVPTGQDGKREKQKKKKSGFGKGFAVGAVTMAVVCGVMFWATSGLGLLSAGSSGDLLNRDTEQKIESLASYIQSNYYEDVDTETLEEGLYAGLFDNLDVYSQYYTAEEAKELFDTSVSGTYCGIGASLQQDDDSKAVTILHVYDGSPAQ